MAKTKAERAAYMREWTRKNKDRLNAERREHYAADERLRERIAIANKAYRDDDPDAYKEKQAQKYLRHGAGYRVRHAEDRAADPEKFVKRAAEQRVRHADKIAADKLEWERQDRAKHPEKYREKQRKHREANPAKYRAKWAQRRGIKKNATPAWANLKKIERVYELAAWASRFTDETLEVDHIIPLQHDMICGLHVEHNLQVIPRSLNRSKSNSWI